jgi:hypothetical protein
MLRTVFDEHAAFVLPEYAVGDYFCNPGDSLVYSVVKTAAGEIDFSTVGHALLIAAGKWNPTPPDPECIRE